MKLAVVLLFVFCYAECRKIVPPIDKNANVAFINMEGGGGARPNSRPAAIEPMKPAGPAPVPVPSKPATAPANAPPKPASPPASPTVVKPPTPTPKPVNPAPTPAKAQPTPTQIQPKPVNPAPVSNPITTPGPGSVKQLINFYDSQGKASPIRPYSYSQAVKQG